MSLTGKQARFCEEYLIDLNATQAAMRAGYSEHTAKQIGSENLSKLDIQEYLQQLMAERSERTQITADNVLREIARLGFADIRDIFSARGGLISPESMGDDIAAAVQSVEVVTRLSSEEDEEGNKVPEYIHKIRLADKKGSLELLGKHLKLFAEKIDHTHNVDPMMQFFNEIKNRSPGLPSDE